MPTPLKAKLFAVLFGLAFASFVWSPLFFSDWFIPTRLVAWWAAAFALPLLVWFVFRSSSATLEKRLVVRLGMVALSASFLWMFFAQTIPAAATRILGSPHQIVAHTARHYWSTASCRYRLVLQEFNPPFGGFCGAGADGYHFTRGEPVNVTYRETMLGRFVMRFDRAR